MRTWIPALIASLALTACGPKSSEATSEPAAAEEAAETPDHSPEEDLRSHMRAHFIRATDARDALVRANLEASKAHLAWVAEHEPFGWMAEDPGNFVAQMQHQAKEATAAEDFTAVGAHIGRLGAVCGDCHQAMEIDPTLWSPDVDVDASHMDEHWFAVVRMWQGLVRYDDKAWAEGAGILNQEPKLHQRDGGELPTAAQAMARQLHEVGARAANVEGQQARGEVYGRILGLCGACHELTGGGPKGD